ncbi:MAG: amidohydrolase [Anaerolineae bacterium]
MIDFKALAESITDELVARRRDLHQHPELAFEEVRTAGIVAEELTRLGLQVQTGVGRTGVVGLLEGAQDGPTVLYRADMDALPILEENDVPYKSQSLYKMHACGHDGHVSIALGVAKIMAAQRESIAGRIKFVFQPGEEGAGGALAMIKDGVLDDPEPDVTLGLHIWNQLPLGVIGLAEGATMSGSSTFKILVRGKGGHAAMPHTTIDPVACSGQLITALHTIVGRKMDAMAGAVILSVTGVKTSSYTHNIIPETVEITGTFRTFNAYTSEMLEQHVRDVSRSVCESVGCEADVNVRHLTIPVVNHPEVVGRLRKAFAPIVGEKNINTTERTMASEDVAYMLDEIPGTYFFLGSANKEKGLAYGHHHPRFDFDESVLPLGVTLMCTAISEYVLIRETVTASTEVPTVRVEPLTDDQAVMTQRVQVHQTAHKDDDDRHITGSHRAVEFAEANS